MDFLIKILSIALGGAIGSVVRYSIGISPLQNVFARFPLPTLLINVLGSFLIGFLMFVFTEKFLTNETLRLAVIVGFLGAFTTFSTFELEIFGLLREKNYGTALIYIFLSVFLGLIAVLSGIAAARKLV